MAAWADTVKDFIQPFFIAGYNSPVGLLAHPESFRIDQQLLKAEDHRAAHQSGTDQNIGPREYRHQSAQGPLIAALNIRDKLNATGAQSLFYSKVLLLCHFIGLRTDDPWMI